MRLIRESPSNEIDEHDLHFEKHDEQRTSACRGIVIKVIRWSSKEPVPMRATRRLGSRGGKNADGATMTSYPDAHPTTVADSPAAQTLRSALVDLC
jgi:hypothetical protein